MIRRGLVAAIAVVGLTGAAMVAAPPAGAAATGSLTGTVRNASAAGIPGITVNVLHWYWGSVLATTSTDAAGSYALPALSAGTYRVRFTDPAGNYLDRYSGGSPTWATSSTVTVTSGVATVLDMALVHVPVPSIQGHVTNGAATPLAGITVESRNWYFGTVEATTTTGASGSYSLQGLADGPHRIRFSDPAFTYGDWYSGDSPTWEGSDVVIVSPDATVTLDVSLPPNPTPKIAGTVDNVAGGAVPGITVQALSAVWGTVLATTTTDATGTYAFIGIASGTYRLRFSDPTGHWTTRYSGDSPTWAGSATVTTVPGTTVTVDVTLPDTDPDTVTGTVTGVGAGTLGGIDVELIDVQGNLLDITYTDPNGVYEFTGVPPSGRTLRFSDPTQVRATQFAGGSTTLGGSQSWTYGAGVTHVIDHAMPLAGILSGTVRVGHHPDLTAIPSYHFTPPSVAGLFAVLLDPATGAALQVHTTDAAGSWSFASLAPGTYQVGFAHPSILTPTPSGYRAVIMPGIDAFSVGVEAARAAGSLFTVTAGSTTVAGEEALSGWDCDPAVFHPGASLAGANLAGKNLVGCNLTGATLTNANLQYTQLTFADLNGADLSGVNALGGSLAGADLRGASLAGANLFTISGDAVGIPIFPFATSHTVLNGALIENANLSGAKVSSLDLCLAYPDWTGVVTTGALEGFLTVEGPWTMTGQLFWRGITWYLEWAPGLSGTYPISPASPFMCSTPGHTLDLSGATLPAIAVLGTGWAGVDLHDFSCVGCYFPTGTSFAGSDLAGTDFTNGRFNGANLATANLSNATFLNATGTPVGGATATYANTRCPDGVLTDGTTVLTCVGHGFAP